MNRQRIALISILALSASACSGLHKDPGVGAQSSNPVYNGTVGIKNYTQLAPSMAAVTGVSQTSSFSVNGTTTVLSTQNSQIAPWMSYDGKVQTVTASMLLAITGLAGSYCKVFIANEAAAAAGTRKAHGMVNFQLGPAGLTSDVLTDVLTRYSRLFLRRDLTSDESQILNQGVIDAIAGYGSTTGANSSQLSDAAQSVLLIPCTTVLSSLDFIRA